MEYSERALNIYLDVFGPKHQDTADSYHILGHVHNGKGNYDKAIEYYEQGLKSRLELFGEKNKRVAFSYCNLGFTYDKKGNYEKTIEHYELALNIFLHLFGTKDQNVSTLYWNIGCCFEKLAIGTATTKEVGLRSKKKNGGKSIEIIQKFSSSESSTVW